MCSYYISTAASTLLALWSPENSSLTSLTQEMTDLKSSLQQLTLHRSCAAQQSLYALSSSRDMTEHAPIEATSSWQEDTWPAMCPKVFSRISPRKQATLYEPLLRKDQTREQDRLLLPAITQDKVESVVYGMQSLFFQPLSGSSPTLFTYAASPSQPPEGDALWTELLKTYVNEDGLVDYLRWKREPTQLRRYLAWLRENVPTKSRPRDEQLAYWINLYNASTIDLILRYYPVESIRDIQPRETESPWKIAFIRLPTGKLSLDAVEHDIIGKRFSEPRTHFALVCAAISCPPLRREAYLPERLSEQLDDQARLFLRDPTKNRIQGRQVYISELFKWFEKDFKKEGKLLDYISKYLVKPLYSGAKISYLTYDWTLNAQK